MKLSRSLIIFCLLAIGFAIFILSSYIAMNHTVESLTKLRSDAQILQILDRNGRPLSITYQNPWNSYDSLPLYQIPEFLQQAFILSEDKHFYQHHGVNWYARLRALWQNLRYGHRVSGASTITEQVVRIIKQRPRNLWSKWLEGLEAQALERNFSKADILEFYLNQLPYAANRRGVLQAARYYFARDLRSLTPKEMLALVVLARAPSNYDLYKDPLGLDKAITRLALQMQQNHWLNNQQLAQIQSEVFHLQKPTLPVNAAQFVNFVRTHPTPGKMQTNRVRTTLDASLQQRVQDILDARIKSLSQRNVQNGAVLVVDHQTSEILAWVIAGNSNQMLKDRPPAYQIDAVTTPRQPGSTLKPLLYALALEKGWTAASLIEDAPLAEAIGSGIHSFHNYSHSYYGQVTLREALANSLNIPAVHTINYVGKTKFLHTLHQLGFNSLQQRADYYDIGLALGDGEVTLFELVQAYSALANQGSYRPLRYVMDEAPSLLGRAIYSPEAASIIGNILADPWARHLEFGTGSILNFPVQTAVKTGTSTDYHDAWAVGFNYRYSVGVWLGNLDQSPMHGITGAIGPALMLRSIFSELTRHQMTKPLNLSPKLIVKDVCLKLEASKNCYTRSEYFMPGYQLPVLQPKSLSSLPRLTKPFDGLRLALDPRVPANLQYFGFRIEGIEPSDTVFWYLDRQAPEITSDGDYSWQITPGSHRVKVMVKRQAKPIYQSPLIHFYVK